VILENISKKEVCMITNNYLNYLLSFFYAILFVYIIPWVEIFGSELTDVYFYIDRIIYLKGGGDEAVYTGIAWFFTEPLWKEIIIAVGNNFDGNTFEDFRPVIYGFSFIIMFTYASFIFRRLEFYVAMILLLNPITVDLVLAQIRIAFAFVFVFIAYEIYERNDNCKIVPLFLLIAAFLIHMSMILFYGFYYLLYWLNERVEDKKYYLIAIGAALFLALFMKYGSNAILLAIGDRHADYDKIIDASPVTRTFAWAIIGFILATFAEFKDPKNRVIVGYSITIMFFYFFSSALGVYATRYLAVTMLFILISIGYLPKHIKQGTYLLFFFYTLLQFKYQLFLSIV